ncbi:TauD/TfdA dioxygenase family protein [Caldovatus aquaticus]|uniref:TauD/TfdA family dioxygenase n=1 Tax=Caldovatus aquaticus TaxID=2865671 RepID=A0ABS7F469_9PROT|nr:TauD/TfdA family dioxygenase [Caldovatus aquaticus]MBW8270289.1 TauD/TfdA family dioxygenase [Caldovatus aquaticus]
MATADGAAAGGAGGRWRIERLSGGPLGAEVHGVRLSPGMDAAEIAELRRLWLAHGVLFFRDQEHLGPAEFLGFARRFGEVVEYPFVKGLDGFPEITPVVKREGERRNFGGVWHSDTAYLERPPMATLLIARELPPAGGDTMFADMYAAYEALSPGLRRTLEGLRALNSSRKADASATREDRMRDSGTGRAEVLEAEHPVVRTHPETGRRALYVNIGHTVRFAGWTEEESRPLLDYLFRHLTQPEFTCRFRWRPGSVAFWDNRCTQHYPLNDYHGHRRVMHRVTLAGDRPR